MYSPALLEKLRKQGRLRVLPKLTPSITSPESANPSTSQGFQAAPSSNKIPPQGTTPNRKRIASDSSGEVLAGKISKPGPKTRILSGNGKQMENTEDTCEKSAEDILSSVREKEDRLRQLKLVKVYHKKHSLSDLTALSKKWLDVSQKAAEELIEIVGEPKPSMENLLTSLNIPLSLIRYDPDEETFY